MKRSLIVASCALLLSCFLSSCQKEEKDIVQLTRELTSELQQIKDPTSADAHAERVAVLNKRFQNASVRVLALNSTSLVRGADEDKDHAGASYAEALQELAREIGRVRASFPGGGSGSTVDRDRLLIAIGAVAGQKGAAARKAYGEKYMHDETGANETPGNFPEYYGSEKLREALEYRADINASCFKFDSADDVPALPAAVNATDEDAEAQGDEDGGSAAADTDDAADDTSASSTSDDSSADNDTTDDTTTDDSSSDDSSTDDTTTDDSSSSFDDDDFSTGLDDL